LIIPFSGITQKLAQNFNLSQKSAFIENKGQLTDQTGAVRNDVIYLYSASGLKLHLKNNSISYEVFKIEKQEEEQLFSEATGLHTASNLSDKVKDPVKISVNTHRVDVSFIGSNPNPQLVAEEKTADYNNYYL